MDRIKETAFIITQLNKLNNCEIHDYEFVRDVCRYFDKIKDYKLNEHDYNFLKYLSDKSGIPLYYEMLEKFGHNLNVSNINLQSFSALLYESTLYTSEKVYLHKYQKNILDQFQRNKKNRYLLTASTSFGKTFLVNEIIRKMDYKNILLIFPSIALLSENFEKIIAGELCSFIKENYSIHTLSDIDQLSEKNIFIFTPERYLSFLEKQHDNVKFDFVFIDEIYKIDSDFEIDDEKKENERDSVYRLTSIFTSDLNTDLLLAGPYINIQKNSFQIFLDEKNIEHINYNKYEIVKKYIFKKRGNKYYCDESSDKLDVSKLQNKSDLVVGVAKILLDRNENVIIYSANRGKNHGVEYFAEKMIDSINFTSKFDDYNNFLSHIKNAFSEDWIAYKALCKGIGIHHGLIPKYIQKEIIHFFNKGVIKILISTTTITEGVNTSAKNIIVLHSKKGRKPLLPFDAKNISGRAGRLGHHYSGNVFDLSNDFVETLNKNDEPLKHKSFDENIDKNDIDILYTDEKFLSINDKERRKRVIQAQIDRGIPKDILSMYKMVSWNDKIQIFDAITKLDSESRKTLDTFVEKNHQYFRAFDLNGVQLILNIIEPLVTNVNLLGSIQKKDKNERYSIVCYYISDYLKNGLSGLINYQCKLKDKDYDDAVRFSTKFVFSTLKYQIVKYFGAFNLMYKYIVSQEKEMPIDDVPGIDCLLRYFEYNAVSEIGRKISDYGVPSKLITYYEVMDEKKGAEKRIYDSFDNYERNVFEKTKDLFDTRQDDI